MIEPTDNPTCTCGPGMACSLPDCAGTPFPLPSIKAVFRHSSDPANWGVERLLVLGAQPLILVEPEYAENDKDQIPYFNVDVTDLEPLQAADLLSALADTIREGVETGVPLVPVEDNEQYSL